MKPPRPSTPRVQVPKTAQTQSEVGQLTPAITGKTRADFRVDEFKKLLQQKGYFFRWRKAILCPCLNRETVQTNPDCQTCDASGYFYLEPLQVQGVMTNLEKKKNIYRNLGEWLEGSAMLTIPPEYRPGFRDSFEMLHSVMTFNELIFKGNRRGIRSDLSDGFDVGRYRIVRVLHMMYYVKGRPVLLEQGVHFEITNKGWIHWLPPADAIPDGTVISLNYEFHPVWVVITHSHVIRDTLTKFKQPSDTVQALPLQVGVKLDYMTDIVSDTTSVLRASEVLDASD